MLSAGSEEMSEASITARFTGNGRDHLSSCGRKRNL